MRRRDFLALPATLAVPPASFDLERYFQQIRAGYQRAIAATSASGAAVEFPHATVTKSFLTKSGLSVTGVTRMMPALAAWIAGGHDDGSALTGISNALRHGTDPEHADFWQYPAEGRGDQRQVEASLVAWSVWLLRDKLLPAFTAQERKNVAAWLASCTRQPVRSNNWAWFTAVVQAAGLALHNAWPEFTGNEDDMRADLRFLDTLAAGDSGWYNDDPRGASYDWYNAWVFASHFLYWNEIIGARYPALRDRFLARLVKFLDLAPYFFDAEGRHVLYGRSLIYRWAILTPLTLAYRQKLWPHPPGLLRRIVWRNIAWQARLGAFDEAAGKLRETFTPNGSDAIKESYIDGGHPYWGMQAFVLWSYPENDPFWSAPEMPLPAERADFRRAVPEAGLLLAGSKRSGEVRLYNALSTRTGGHYSNKYNKLVYSSHCPFTTSHDNTLQLRHGDHSAGRGPVLNHNVSNEGVSLSYHLELDGLKLRVDTEIGLEKDAERRRHSVKVISGVPAGFELVEGGSASTKPRPRVEVISGWSRAQWTPCPGSVTERATFCWLLRGPADGLLTLESRHRW